MKRVVPQRLSFLVILWLAHKIYPICARRVLIWRLLARTNRSILKSDWTGNLLTTTIDALIRAKAQQEQYESGSATSTSSTTTTGAMMAAAQRRSNKNNHRLANQRGGAVLASSSHHTTRNTNHTLAFKLRTLILQNPLVASPWTIGAVIGTVAVVLILQKWLSSYSGVTLEDWELMCRDQLPDFWKAEVLPLLESSGDTEHWNGRLAKKMIRKTKPLMKKRIQLAAHVSTILGNHLKTRQPLTSSEKETLATYYAEITVEKLHSVTEGLRQKLEQSNTNTTSTNLDQRRPSTTRYLGDRSTIMQGLVQRIRTYMDGDAILLDETTLREYFKESLREAIIVVSSDDANDANNDDELPLDSTEHEQSLSNDEPVTVEVDPIADSIPEASTIVNEAESDATPTKAEPREVVEEEQ